MCPTALGAWQVMAESLCEHPWATSRQQVLPVPQHSDLEWYADTDRGGAQEHTAATWAQTSTPCHPSPCSTGPRQGSRKGVQPGLTYAKGTRCLSLMAVPGWAAQEGWWRPCYVAPPQTLQGPPRVQ